MSRIFIESLKRYRNLELVQEDLLKSIEMFKKLIEQQKLQIQVFIFYRIIIFLFRMKE